ncbi:MAG TPA: hypothetical protein VHT26_18920 [Trebonia sp.]|jgi:hypothetical protein|nr:hypothetical protein [Trebonia sp.]
MPSSWHDSVTAIFTENPRLAVEIATSLNGAQLPLGVPVRTETRTFNDRPSTDFEADAVIVAGPVREPVRAVIVEAQKRTLHDKPPQWARYAAQLWTFLRCPVDVLVICPDAKSAFWYARPVPTTLPGYIHLPIVLPPSAVPAITSPDEVASRPAMAALAVAYHGADPAVCRAFAGGLRQLPQDHAVKYYEHAFNMAPLAVQRILEQLMTSGTWPVYSPFAKEHFGRGKTEAILLVLEARGLEVTDAERERITGCTDLKQLNRWITRAATAEKTSDIFR